MPSGYLNDCLKESDNRVIDKGLVYPVLVHNVARDLCVPRGTRAADRHILLRAVTNDISGVLHPVLTVPRHARLPIDPIQLVAIANDVFLLCWLSK